jgi:hypothetical protein
MGLPGRPGLEWGETGFFNYIENLPSLLKFLVRKNWNFGMKRSPAHLFSAPDSESGQRLNRNNSLLWE